MSNSEEAINHHDEIKQLIMLRLRKKDIVTAEMIREQVTFFVKSFHGEGIAKDINEEALFRELSSLTSVWQPDPSILRDGKHKNWLPERKATIQWDFWKRYRQYLEEEKMRPTTVTTQLDKVTDMILGDIGNPEQVGEEWWLVKSSQEKQQIIPAWFVRLLMPVTN